MPTITITCSRCKKATKGWIDGATLEISTGTAGFYNLKSTYRAKYAREDELVLCDSCMWEDQLYQSDYPHTVKAR